MAGAVIAGATIAAVLVGIGEAGLVTVERHLGLDAGLLFFAFPTGLASGGR